MKKLLFLLGGVTLTACTTDSVFDAVDQRTRPTEENGPQNQTNSFNNNNSGQSGWYSSTGIGWPGENYISPWDIWYRNHPNPVPGFGVLQPWYYITNGNVDDPSPYDIRVYSYVGLAYFDGVNDGVFNDTNPYSPNTISLTTNFPTLYTTNNQEAGNLVRVANAFTVPANSGLRLEDRLLHLPDGNNPAPSSSSLSFQLAGIGLTAQEQNLLYEYGKVFFYEVEVYDSTTGTLVLSTLMHPEINTLPSGKLDPGWKRVRDLSGNPLSGNIPGFAATAPLFYFHDTTQPMPQDTQWNIAAPFNGNLCNSREVVFDVTNVPHEVDIDGTHKLKLGFFASGQTGWVNSALHLTVTGR